MEINVLNIKGEDTGRKVTLNESVFGIEPNDHVIYLDVKRYMAAQRQGTAKAKERSEHAGSTRKLGRQKGGGGARRGDINSPLLRGGGRVFVFAEGVVVLVPGKVVFAAPVHAYGVEFFDSLFREYSAYFAGTDASLSVKP